MQADASTDLYRARTNSLIVGLSMSATGCRPGVRRDQRQNAELLMQFKMLGRGWHLVKVPNHDLTAAAFFDIRSRSSDGDRPNPTTDRFLI